MGKGGDKASELWLAVHWGFFLVRWVIFVFSGGVLSFYSFNFVHILFYWRIEWIVHTQRLKVMIYCSQV